MAISDRQDDGHKASVEQIRSRGNLTASYWVLSSGVPGRKLCPLKGPAMRVQWIAGRTSKALMASLVMAGRRAH